MLPNERALLSSGLTCTQSCPPRRMCFCQYHVGLIFYNGVTEKMRQLCHVKVTVEWLALLMW